MGKERLRFRLERGFRVFIKRFQHPESPDSDSLKFVRNGGRRIAQIVCSARLYNALVEPKCHRLSTNEVASIACLTKLSPSRFLHQRLGGAASTGGTS